ncbi:MAG: polyprenyl synthetase family protein [Opitutales bacterium]
MALKEKLARIRQSVECEIDHLLPPPVTRPVRLHTAMRYSMEAGGKRIRPVLLLLASELFPGEGEPLHAAVAVECLHTYTLIHDDLPSIDNSDLRRGRPACHRQFDEATALLAGDALLTQAFQILAQNYADAPDLAMQLVAELANASGSRRLIGGQMEDIENEGKTIDRDALAYVHENKTAALITAALVMGLRFGEPNSAKIDLMRRAGFHLGMNFQIIDDILDATSDPTIMGKPVGHDAAAEKSTYVALHGIEGAREQAARHAASATDAIREMGGANDTLIELIEALGERAF